MYSNISLVNALRQVHSVSINDEAVWKVIQDICKKHSIDSDLITMEEDAFEELNASAFSHFLSEREIKPVVSRV